MSESQYNHPDNVARRIAKSIADQSFDDETIDEDEEFLLAYGDRWCKQKYGELGYPSPGSPNAALLVLHRGDPEVVCCPWCQEFHWGTVPAYKDTPCQPLEFARGEFGAKFPPSYHVQVLYDYQ